MTTKRLVDPELAPMLELFPTSDLTAESLPDVRAMLRGLLGPDATTTGQEYFAAADDGAEVRLLAYGPAAHRSGASLPAILHIHGGGYVAGTPDASDPHNRRLADAIDCIVVSVDYRLAPEHPHPVPVEDCYAALRWMHDQPGIDPARIAVMGESAGGGLAAALALLARDRGEFALAYQLLVYPMIDDRTCTAGPGNEHVGEFIWNNRSNQFGWQCLLGHGPGAEAVAPYAAAARHDDLAGLPPAYIATGGLDLFLEENLDYAKRLMRAGVPVELHVYPGAFHAFQMAADARVTKAYQRDVESALARALNG